MSSRTRMISFVAVALVSLLVGAAGGAMYMQVTVRPTPTMTLTASTVQAGKPFTVQLSGFPANTEIYGWTVNEDDPRTFSAGVTDSQGKLEATGNAPLVTGQYPLVACDEDYKYSAMAVLTVT